MQRKLLESGNIFKRSDGRWNGVVWYSDEQSSKKRKSFCGTSKQEVKDKITAYLADFDRQLTASDESKAKFEESMGKWLRVFKFPSVERGTYDRLECTAKYQIYPILGGKVVGDITSADIKALLNHWMNEGYAYTTVKKVYNILTDYFRYLTQQEYIPKNPMAAAPMIKKSNFMASQGKEDLPTFETVTIFTPEEITKFKAEAVRTWENGTPIYQQAAAYTLMLNTGLRTGEALGLLNSDIDLENRVIHLQRGVKEVFRREGTESTSGREVKIGKLKSTSSKRDVPLNQAAVDAILTLRAERYFGEDRNCDHLHPGGDHKVQGGGCQDLGKRDAHLSAGGRLYADAEHRTPHRRSPRTAEQRHRSGEPRHPPPAGRERGFQAGRHRIHQRPGGEDRQAEEHLQQTGCAPQSGGSGRHPDSESGAILRRGQPSHLG